MVCENMKEPETKLECDFYSNVKEQSQQRPSDSDENADFDGENEPDATEEFATSTTMHGVIFCYSSKSRTTKWLWIFLLIGMAFVLVYHVGARVGEYLLRDTVTSITEEYEMSMPFPAVTMCSFNRIYSYTDDPQVLESIHTFNQLISPATIAQNLHQNITLNVTKVTLLDPDANTTRLLTTRGFRIDQYSMPYCIFNGRHCTGANFTQVFSPLGLCHTFNIGDEDIMKTQDIAGAGNGLSVTIFAHTNQFTEEPINGIRDYGMRLQVHERGDTPDVEDFGISIPVGMKASIELDRMDCELMERPWGRCDPTREKLKYFEHYTLRNCFHGIPNLLAIFHPRYVTKFTYAECYTDAVLQHCGCYLYSQRWAAGAGRECTLEETQDCAGEFYIRIQRASSARTCGCSVPCKHTQYKTSLSYAGFPSPTTADYVKERYNFSERESIENFMRFNVYFKTMSYTKYKESKKIDESSLISDIGGQLGLWLGMSAITAVELIRFCARKLTECGRKRRRETRRNSVSG